MWGSVLDNATFVLTGDKGRSGQSEGTAADQLLGELASLAHGQPAPAADKPGCTEAAPRPRAKGAKRATKRKPKH
jgi:hypothetical protein